MSYLSQQSTAYLLPAAISFVCFVSAPPCFAQSQVPSPVQQLGIAEGTQVHLSLLKSIKSGGNKAGEAVPFEVAKDVYGLDHALLIAANTPAFGKIVESSRRGMFGKSGKLKFTIDYILAPDKTHIPLRADAQIIRGRDNRTASIAAAILLAPIAIFINGKDVSADKGQDFVMYVSAATKIQSITPLMPVTISSAVFDPLPVLVAQSLFVLTDGTQVQGTLTSFDGTQYTVSTPGGLRTLEISAVKSVYALTPAPAAAAPPK